jgi:tight adherence protein C
MLYVLLAFFGVFLLVVCGWLLLFYRESMADRVTAVITPNLKKDSFKSQLEKTGLSLAGLLGFFEKLMPRSAGETTIIQQRLIRAGLRNETAMNYFYSAKVLVPLLLCALALVTGFADMLSPVFVYMMCLALGFLAPDFWLGRVITNRQAKIRRGLPDVLDLLVICIEAGLGLDQATARTAEELRTAQPVIADELGVVVLEQRAGKARAEAWRHLADRTGVDAVQNVVSVLIQSEKFGTSVAKNLRIHSEVMRTKRRQHVEEQAAKTTVKLVFPLVLFIFPTIFVVTIGPAAIMMMESFAKFLTH